MRRWPLRFQRSQGTQRARTPLFTLGELIVTPETRHARRQTSISLGALLKRHQRGDRGLVEAIDCRQNDLCIRMPILR
jgi:hypothetical protein